MVTFVIETRYSVTKKMYHQTPVFFRDGSMHREAPARAALKRVPRQESLQARASSKAGR